jgi:Coenzyme PQQ synthesis protein D (PqqD)
MMLTLRAGVSIAQTDYGWVLLDEHDGTWFSLNSTAVLALEVLLDGGDTGAAVRRVTDQYDVSPATARTDIDDLVRDLRAAALVTEADS